MNSSRLGTWGGRRPLIRLGVAWDGSHQIAFENEPKAQIRLTEIPAWRLRQYLAASDMGSTRSRIGIPLGGPVSPDTGVAGLGNCPDAIDEQPEYTLRAGQVNSFGPHQNE